MSETGDPSITSLILDKLKMTEENLNRRLDESDRNTNRRLDTQDTALVEIRTQTQLTNGRVTTLEKARERTQGVISAYRWLPTALSAILGAGLTILVMALSGGIHV